MSEKGPARKKALLVDDDMDFRLQQRMLLESMGLEVVEAETRAQAEKILDETRPDIAVIDL
ncbi:MAG: diguanylate cyclase response regulator, partial [Kiritimatiellae bacterium]|nr:diguanylate cyclase response regulator [Kiritimatiellia bacterium]